MGIGDVGERRDHALGGARRSELGPRDQRLAGTACERAGSVRIDPGGGEGRARVAGRRTRAAACGREQRAGAEDDRFAPGQAHGAPIPAITLSRVVWRATHATATAPASTNPPNTAAISTPLAPSGSVT